jgi:hypothetical protein
MSYSTLIGINRRPEGHGWPCETANLVGIEKMQNAWGTAPVIWANTWRKYVTTEGNWLNEKVLRVLCSLAKNEDEGVMPAHSAALLRFCFDRGVVLKGQYARFAQDVRKWLADFPTEEGSADHWPRIAEIFESDPPYDAIGLHSTSVSENPFILVIHTEEEDGETEWRPVGLASCHDVYADASRVLTCAFCGEEYPQDTPAAGAQVLVDHIRTCGKHPMRELEARHKRLTDAAYVMIDCATEDEARALLAVMKLMPQDNEDVCKAIGLVTALLPIDEQPEVQP